MRDITVVHIQPGKETISVTKRFYLRWAAPLSAPRAPPRLRVVTADTNRTRSDYSRLCAVCDTAALSHSILLNGFTFIEEASLAEMGKW